VEPTLCFSSLFQSPFPLAAIGIGATLLIFGLLLVEVRGLKQLNIFYNIGLPLGGIGVLVASMFSFSVGDTFVAVFAGNLGGLIGSVSLVFLPWTGIQAAYIETSIMEGGTQEEGVLALYKALGIVFLIAMIPVFAVWAASFKTAFPVSGGALLIVIALILQGVNLLEYPHMALQKASGALFIVVGVVLWYSALSTMLQEEGINVPYFPLPRQDA